MSDLAHEMSDLDFEIAVGGAGIDPLSEDARALARQEFEGAARALARQEFAGADTEADLRGLEASGPLKTAEDYQHVARWWTRLKDEVDRRLTYFKPRKARARAVWQDWVDAEHESIDAYVAAIEKGAGLLGAYDSEQRRIAEQTRQQLEAEERMKAEAEQFVAALDADSAGESGVAREILVETPMVAPPSVPPQTPQVEGMSTTGKWKCELAVPGKIDKLVLAAAEELTTQGRARVAVSMLKADPVAMKQQATSMKGNLQLIAGKLGLKVWEDRTPRRT